MKKEAVIALVALISISALAAPRTGNPNGKDYYLGAEIIAGWSCGIYSDNRDRDIDIDRLTTSMDTEKIGVYAGYDVKPWMTAYLSSGTARTKIGNFSDTDGNSEFAFGAIFNLLSYDIMAPTLMEDLINVNACVQLTWGEASWGNESVDWQELYGSLTLSVINEVSGNKLYLPQAIALFFGPVFSDLYSSSFDERDKTGMTAGIEVFYTDRVTFNIGVEKFDSARVVGGLNVHF